MSYDCGGYVLLLLPFLWLITVSLAAVTSGDIAALLHSGTGDTLSPEATRISAFQKLLISESVVVSKVQLTKNLMLLIARWCSKYRSSIHHLSYTVV